MSFYLSFVFKSSFLKLSALNLHGVAETAIYVIISHKLCVTPPLSNRVKQFNEERYTRLHTLKIIITYVIIIIVIMEVLLSQSGIKIKFVTAILPFQVNYDKCR